ncbi:MAG TPA: bestrophin family ion channel [Cytophagaceae bacterium]|jgi:putative membrane protein|nr:bestrophin family ion channel [Cytophagaceae bacterium]
MIKNIWNGFSDVDTSTLVSLLPNVFAVGVYSGVIYYLEYDLLKLDFKPTPTVFSLLGVVLGLLLVFRTNTAYERWWEGRRIWGGLVDASRNLAIKLDAYLPAQDTQARVYFAKTIANYFFALKEHLRDGVKFEELEEPERGEFDDLKKSNHVPNRISTLLFTRINKLATDKVITQEQLLTMDKLADVFTNSVGGCERIKNTPIPHSYSKHLDRFMLVYTLILPFGFMHDLHWWTVPTMMIVYFTMEGIKTIGEEIEDPFGRDENDLQTDSISQKMRGNIKEILVK